MGTPNSELATSMNACNSHGPTIVQIAKLYNVPNTETFNAFGRVLSGIVRKGMKVKVLGEGYSEEDNEDMAESTVEDVWIPGPW